MNVHTQFGGKLFAVVAFAAGALAVVWLLPFLVLLPFVTVDLAKGYAFGAVWVIMGTFQPSLGAAFLSGALYAAFAARRRPPGYGIALPASLAAIGLCAAGWALTESTEYLEYMEAMEEPTYRKFWTLYFLATSPLQAYVAERWSRRWLAPAASAKLEALPPVSSQRNAPEV